MKAEVVELVDTQVSDACGGIPRGGSNPLFGKYGTFNCVFRVIPAVSSGDLKIKREDASWSTLARHRMTVIQTYAGNNGNEAVLLIVLVPTNIPELSKPAGFSFTLEIEAVLPNKIIGCCTTLVST